MKYEGEIHTEIEKKMKKISYVRVYNLSQKRFTTMRALFKNEREKNNGLWDWSVSAVEMMINFTIYKYSQYFWNLGDTPTRWLNVDRHPIFQTKN